MTTRQRSNLANGIAGYREGSGPAMMLIHGVGMNAGYWNNIVDDLAHHFTLTVVDMPGHGQSEKLTQQSLGLSHYTDAIVATIEKPCIVVGHSMGALIALDMAVRFSEKITGAAILNGIYRRDEPATREIKQRVAQLNSSVSNDPTSTLQRWFGESPTGPLATAAENCRQWLADVDLAAYAAAYTAFAAADAPTDAQLSSIKWPVLFMTGEQEPNSTPAMSKAMSALVPESCCMIIPNAKHMRSLTHGPQTSSGIINFFLKT